MVRPVQQAANTDSNNALRRAMIRTQREYSINHDYYCEKTTRERNKERERLRIGCEIRKTMDENLENREMILKIKKTFIFNKK